MSETDSVDDFVGFADIVGRIKAYEEHLGEETKSEDQGKLMFSNSSNNRGGYNGFQGGNRGGYNRGGYNRGSYNKGDYNKGGNTRGGYGRGDYGRGGYNRGGYGRGNYGDSFGRARGQGRSNGQNLGEEAIY
ncbi:PREDICTED: glycine-rich RNA-binding protein 1-like [Camelina sativa]|uniref:Glycine-rich RNA-binding protein 1-like n=1 Tax=Camelina sativa TaxID=90675 RepID=A0ABM0XSM1_CAMSA|nr:PREDICTED: glycine-rich RNA-binding protein 1-like [Camelina sativa]